MGCSTRRQQAMQQQPQTLPSGSANAVDCYGAAAGAWCRLLSLPRKSNSVGKRVACVARSVNSDTFAGVFHVGGNMRRYRWSCIPGMQANQGTAARWRSSNAKVVAGPAASGKPGAVHSGNGPQLRPALHHPSAHSRNARQPTCGEVKDTHPACAPRWARERFPFFGLGAR